MSLLVLSAVVLLYVWIAPRLFPLPVYMSLPEVTMTDQDNQPYALNQARGKVVVLSLIYTHCPDICPLTTAKMKQIQERLLAEGSGPQVQMITFTVDPQRDTPAVLKRFSDVYGVNPANWEFLTGTQDQTQVMIKTLALYVERVYYIDKTPVPESALAKTPADMNYSVNHSDLLFVADRAGRVRAILPGSRTELEQAIQAIHQVIQTN